VTRLRAERSGFDSRHELGIFHFATASRPALGLIHPLIQWVPGAFSLEVKRLGWEVYHSPPSSAEVKNAWSYTSTPPCVFMAWYLLSRGNLLIVLIVWYLVEHRDSFTFTVTLMCRVMHRGRCLALGYAVALRKLNEI
jgi:hypothetical protein